AEHEAFVTLLGRSSGLATYDVVSAASTIDDDALLVLRGDPRSLGSLPRDELDDGLPRSAWDALARLDEINIAHQQIDPATVSIVGGEVGFVDFSAAAVAPTSLQLATDQAHLFMTTACLQGTAPAIAGAVDALGADGVTAVLPYLQTAALPG